MKKAFLLLLFVPFLFSCSSEDDRLISEKLRTLKGKSTLFWHKPDSSRNYECVTAWFQNGHVYSQRCVTLSVYYENNGICNIMDAWRYYIPLDEITVLDENKGNIVFSYRNDIYEVLLFNNEKTVQFVDNDSPEDRLTVNKISESKLVEWETWEDNCEEIRE